MNSKYSESFNLLLKDESFLTFLKCQVQGVFNNYNCNHYLSSDNICFTCIKEFIQKCQFKDYFEHLYNWFKHVNFQQKNRKQNQFNSFDKDFHNHNHHNIYFHPKKIIKCFKTITNHLTQDEASYFCSPWLDGMYVNPMYEKTIYTIFKTLCEQEYFETLQWLYECTESCLRLTKNEQYLIFMALYLQKPHKNSKTPQILKWLLSLKGFQDIDVHGHGEDAFYTACLNGNIEIIEILLKLEGNQRINVHIHDDAVLRNACDKGHIDLVKLLLNLTGDRYFDVHACKEAAFRWACNSGHLEIIKLLLELKGDRRVDTHANNDQAFEWACDAGHIEVAKLLLNLEEDRRFDINSKLNPDRWISDTLMNAHSNKRLDIVELLESL